MDPDDPTPPPSPQGPPEPTRADLAFRLHRGVFFLGNGILTAVNMYTGSPWWAFWPLVGWGIALMVHFLFYRAASVDDAWVEERTQDLRAKSYDLAHIDSIREQARRSGSGAGDPSASKPPGGREGEKP